MLQCVIYVRGLNNRLCGSNFSLPSPLRGRLSSLHFADVEGRRTPGAQRSEAAERRSFSPAQPRGGSRNASLKDGDGSSDPHAHLTQYSKIVKTGRFNIWIRSTSIVLSGSLQIDTVRLFRLLSFAVKRAMSCIRTRPTLDINGGSPQSCHRMVRSLLTSLLRH